MYILHFSSQSNALPADGYRGQKLQCPRNKRGMERQLQHHHLLWDYLRLDDYLFNVNKNPVTQPTI